MSGMELDIEGLDDLTGKMSNLSAGARSAFEKALGKAIKDVQSRAKLLCPVNEGELRNSIKTDVTSRGEDIEAVCYTNKSYAMYVEFGTGPKGQQNHSGISPAVNPVYKSRGWAFPASAITSGPYKFAEREYHGIKYYLTNGQAAQPFMYPALKDGERDALNTIRSTFISKLEELEK